MSHQTTLKDSPNAISSQGSESGALPYAEQVGQMIAQSGQEAVLASLSARQVKEAGLMMSGISSPPFTTSSNSVALQRLLESRLRARTQSLGSTLYKLTWKPWATPSGPSRSRLRASVLRTSETAYTGWPTPATRDYKGGYEGGRIRDGKISTDTLDVAAQLSGWLTPNCMDTLPPKTGEALARNKAKGGCSNLREHVMELDQNPSAARLTASGELLIGSSVGMESGGQLNPAHSRWLMGLPQEWDVCAPTETQSTLKRRRSSLSA